jgi:hypothetical protein
MCYRTFGKTRALKEDEQQQQQQQQQQDPEEEEQEEEGEEGRTRLMRVVSASVAEDSRTAIPVLVVLVLYCTSQHQY